MHREEQLPSIETPWGVASWYRNFPFRSEENRVLCLPQKLGLGHERDLFVYIYRYYYYQDLNHENQIVRDSPDSFVVPKLWGFHIRLGKIYNPPSLELDSSQTVSYLTMQGPIPDLLEILTDKIYSPIERIAGRAFRVVKP